jgi:plastocyanin
MKTTSSLASIAVVLGMLFWSASPSAAADTSKPTTHTVTIEGTSFLPAVLTVRKGDSVVWINKDPFPHTATSEAGGFDSQRILPDGSWTYTPAKRGAFAYTCTYHTTMKGMLRVE